MGIKQLVAATNFEDAADLDSTINSYFDEKLDVVLKDINAANRLGMEYLHCANILTQTAINLRPFHGSYSLELRAQAQRLRQQGYDVPHDFVASNAKSNTTLQTYSSSVTDPVWVQTFLDFGEHTSGYEARNNLRHTRQHL